MPQYQEQYNGEEDGEEGIAEEIEKYTEEKDRDWTIKQPTDIPEVGSDFGKKIFCEFCFYFWLCFIFFRYNCDYNVLENSYRHILRILGLKQLCVLCFSWVFSKNKPPRNSILMSFSQS